MQQYDVVLKLLLQKSVGRLTGTNIVRWLQTELPNVQNLRIDLLGEGAEGELTHIEVQSGNDPGIPFRMLEYLVLVTRVHGRVPRQILLYVGRDPLRMDTGFAWADGEARFHIIDMRDVDGEPFLASPEPSDNVLSILGRLKDRRAAVRNILQNLSGLPRDEAETYVETLRVLAGLRELEEIVEEEARHMLDIDLLLSENKVLGPAYNRGLQEGREDGRRQGLQEGLQEGLQQGLRQGLRQGLQEGLQEGLQQGQLGLLRRLIERRFGTLPPWAEDRLGRLTALGLERASLRLLDASRLEDLFE